MSGWGGWYGLGPARKKAKTSGKKKKSYNNWFEKCSGDELKQLCKAACLPVSGTKTALAERLCQSDLAKPYAYEYSPERFSFSAYSGYYSDDGLGCKRKKKETKGASRPDGLSNETIKQRCKDKGLVVSGKRFDLVLRLLQSETSEKTGIEPKKAAGTFNEETGKFEPKVRAKSMKLPDPAKLDERARKKACPSDKTTNRWSNYKFKQHSGECVSLAAGIIEKEVFEKDLFNRGEEELAWKVIIAVTHWIVDEEPTGMGYCNYEFGCDLIPKLVKAMKATSSKDKIEEYGGAALLRRLHSHARGYSLDVDDLKVAIDEMCPSTSP